MKTVFASLLVGMTLLATTTVSAQSPGAAYQNADFKLKAAQVTYDQRLDALVFEIRVEGQAGRTTPKPVGSMNGAPVLAYVFPTNLKSEDVGFSKTEGVVALALTSHPDMDDTPLWDENNDGKFDNDGLVWHPHWVVLTKDQRVPGGLSVKEFKQGDATVQLPKTAPGVPMYFDSPGFNVVTSGVAIRVLVPAYRINNQKTFKFDAVTCYLQMSHDADHQHIASQPMLGVYTVYGVLSGNLSLPYSVTKTLASK